MCCQWNHKINLQILTNNLRKRMSNYNLKIKRGNGLPSNNWNFNVNLNNVMGINKKKNILLLVDVRGYKLKNIYLLTKNLNNERINNNN